MHQTRLIGAAIAMTGGALLISAWGYSGFRISNSDIERMMPISSSPNLFGCYRYDNLVITLGESGMSIPGSGIKFSRSALSDGKQGSFVAFEPAIDFRKGRNGQLEAHEDPRSQTTSKLFIRHEKASRQLVAVSATPTGLVFQQGRC